MRRSANLRLYGGEEVTPQDTPMDPYVLFVGAFLHRVLLDSQGRNLCLSGQSPTYRQHLQAEVQDYLANTAALAWWVTLTGADAAQVVPQLRGA